MKDKTTTNREWLGKSIDEGFVATTLTRRTDGKRPSGVSGSISLLIDPFHGPAQVKAFHYYKPVFDEPGLEAEGQNALMVYKEALLKLSKTIAVHLQEIDAALMEVGVAAPKVRAKKTVKATRSALTKAGKPRKKPGPKPGSKRTPKAAPAKKEPAKKQEVGLKKVKAKAKIKPPVVESPSA